MDTDKIKANEFTTAIISGIAHWASSDGDLDQR
jgi:hypothetical protein